jgi:hypothetical protein
MSCDECEAQKRACDDQAPPPKKLSRDSWQCKGLEKPERLPQNMPRKS